MSEHLSERSTIGLLLIAAIHLQWSTAGIAQPASTPAVPTLASGVELAAEFDRSRTESHAPAAIAIELRISEANL